MGGIQRRSSKLQRGVEAPRLGSGCPWNWFRVLEGMAMLVVWKTREESRGHVKYLQENGASLEFRSQ